MNESSAGAGISSRKKIAETVATRKNEERKELSLYECWSLKSVKLADYKTSPKHFERC